MRLWRQNQSSASLQSGSIVQAVAQIFNLLYRRIAFGQVLNNRGSNLISDLLRIANPRHSRLQICATAFENRHRTSRAFSLIEIMVVVGLLSLIILGLMAMFGQVQRAFRGSMTQTDVLEGGRMVTDMLARELEQVTPTRLDALNFEAALPKLRIVPALYQPLVQDLPGTSRKRTNLLEEVFFLTRENRNWTGVGYIIDRPHEGVGSLYRYERSQPVTLDPFFIYSDFQNATRNAALTNMSRIIDGVVHFRVRTYDTNGHWITPNLIASRGSLNAQAAASWSPGVLNELQFIGFSSNAVPAFIEFELGVLEPRALERFKSLPTTAAKRQYLEDAERSARVHLFRQRVPVRNVDPSAYQ